MQHIMREDSGRLMVALEGSFGFTKAKNFHPILEAIEKPSIMECEINVSGLSFMDSTAISLFLAVHDTLRERNGSLTVRGAQGAVRDILKRVRIDSLINMV